MSNSPPLILTLDQVIRSQIDFAGTPLHMVVMHTENVNGGVVITLTFGDDKTTQHIKEKHHD